jgi:hypothetical protein
MRGKNLMRTFWKSAAVWQAAEIQVLKSQLVNTWPAKSQKCTLIRKSRNSDEQSTDLLHYIQF